MNKYKFVGGQNLKVGQLSTMYPLERALDNTIYGHVLKLHINYKLTFNYMIVQ